MNNAKRKKLEAKGWKVGNAQEFLGLSAEEAAYGNEPFFVKKANDSKEFLEKHGLPKAFQTRSSKA